jgi:DNA-binding NtrC family response regulator
MSTTADFDILTTADKPALVGLSNPELLEASKAALEQLGYKVHIAINHGEFLHKFAQTQYHVVVLEDTFACSTEEENESLTALQRMPMALRRHTVAILFGNQLATFNPVQAFQKGVHAAVNPAEVFLLTQLIQKAVSDNDIFLQTFRQAQAVRV